MKYIHVLTQMTTGCGSLVTDFPNKPQALPGYQTKQRMYNWLQWAKLLLWMRTLIQQSKAAFAKLSSTSGVEILHWTNGCTDKKNGRKLFSGFHHQYWKAHTVFFFPVLTPLPTHSLLAASPCSYLWNEKKENKSTASCWTKTCSFPRICVTIVDGENGLLLKERKCSASYFQKQSTTCINVFISTKNTSAREPNKRVFTVCLGSALNLFCLSCLFLLRPPSLSLSLHAVQPGKQEWERRVN